MKKIFWWIIFILLFIWQLPQNLVAIVMMPFIGKLTLKCERHYSFCFEANKMPMGTGISLGSFAFVSKSLAKRDPYVAHEINGHTKDSKIFGPLYLFVIGIPSILNAAFDFTECYYDFYTEKLANKHAGILVTKKKLADHVYGILSFKEGSKL